MKRQSKSAREDESLGMRRGKEADKKQSYKSRRDESEGASHLHKMAKLHHNEMKKYMDDLHKLAKKNHKQGYNARLDESLGERQGKESSKKQSYKARRDESRGARKR